MTVHTHKAILTLDAVAYRSKGKPIEHTTVLTMGGKYNTMAIERCSRNPKQGLTMSFSWQCTCLACIKP